MFLSLPSTAATSFTLSSLFHYNTFQSTFGAGSTVTNQYGFNVTSSLTGATNNYGFYSDIASGSGRWNFYANGTANNYFAGNVGIGATPNSKLYIRAATNANLRVTDSSGTLNLSAENDAGSAQVAMKFNGSQMMLDASGNLLVNTTSAGGGTAPDELATGAAGARLLAIGFLGIGRESNVVARFNRSNDDGVIIQIAQAGVDEGNISVSGSTVSYNGGHLSRWAQTTAAKDESLKKGTVLSNLDEMNVYIAPTTYWTEEDELPEGVNVGDVKVETHEVQNEQLNKVKVSDVEGDANVAGVFVNWTYDEAHQVDEINMAMTGDMIIRIAEGMTVARGDLLMSAGDGTAKPQGDDIVRSKTIAKVTSTHVTCTYDDGSYCVPCVLMAC
jgi:hypothetical protein